MYEVQINERGQITIPKQVREKANMKPKDTVNLQYNDKGQVVISKKDFFDELDDLIMKDLIKEGCPEYELKKAMPERKKALAKVLLEMAEETEQEIGNTQHVSLEQLHKDILEDK